MWLSFLRLPPYVLFSKNVGSRWRISLRAAAEKSGLFLDPELNVVLGRSD